MKERICTSLAINMFIVVCILILVSGCGVPDPRGDVTKNQRESEDILSEDKAEDSPDYEPKMIEMDQKEMDEVSGKLFALMEKCRQIYIDSLADGNDASSVDGINLPEETVHEMIDTAAADGGSVTCGGRDYNMTNYEQVDTVLKEAEAGKDAETEFFQINTIGIFRYYHLQFHEKELTVTYLSAMFDETMECYIQQMEKIRVYRWEYTKKGWLIWEKALTRNQEMDMHIFYRILPLDEQCRDIMEHYIVPVSYLSNNLFLEDWDESSLNKIEFNDLYEYLYEMATGNTLNEETYSGGIPKEEFETVIQQYFDIQTEEIEEYARYDAVKGTYPWSAVHALNRVQQFQPFPEVVRCEENTEGEIKAYVEAIYMEEGTDYAFGHVVTFHRMEDGRLIYAGNQVDRENARLIPGYRPRRELEER